MGDSKKEKGELSRKEKKLKEAVKNKTKEAEEYLSQMKYLKADFENYKKRMNREKEEFTKYATEKLVHEILTVVDNLERAINAGGKEGSSLLEGVEMTYKQLNNILEKEGVKCIKAEGEIFDPHLHECVMTEETDKHEEDAVIQEIQKGYTLNSRVIRHSKVKIAKR